MKPTLPQLSRRQWSGIACIYGAGLLWLADFAALFSSLPNKWLIFITAAGLGEVLFVLGIFLLGKETYRQLKAAYLKRLSGQNKTGQ
jgi:energy-converting hydrogenase Eha subunit G